MRWPFVFQYRTLSCRVADICDGGGPGGCWYLVAKAQLLRQHERASYACGDSMVFAGGCGRTGGYMMWEVGMLSRGMIHRVVVLDVYAHVSGM